MEVLQEIRSTEALTIETQTSPIVTGQFTRFVVRMRIIRHLFSVARKELGSVWKAFIVLRALRQKYRAFFDEAMFSKVANVDGRYFWRVAAPGYPSRALKLVQSIEVHRATRLNKHAGLRTLLLGVTRKCPMRCQHCYEWDNLHQAEMLTKQDLSEIVRKYQRYGTGQIIFGGGEPMLRLRQLCDIVRNADRFTEFWLYTSGFHLGEIEAAGLKEAGFTGVMVSLDHHRADRHDRFRGFAGAFQNATRAAVAAKHARLVVGLALCTTNEYTTETNIRNYMDLARRLGASFVQFLEPKAAGRYAGQEVCLKNRERELLENLCREYNHDSVYRDYPIINYPESVIRKIGCFSGDRLLYINTLGQVQQCPFCSNATGSALDLPVEQVMETMRGMSCPDYHKSTL